MKSIKAILLNRKQLLHWVFWFGIINAVVIMLISTNYLFGPVPNTAYLAGFRGILLKWGFLLATFIGHFSMLALLASIPAFLAAMIIPKKRFVQVIAMLCLGGLILYILSDAFVYHSYHYHLMSMTVLIIGSMKYGQVISFSKMEMLGLGLVITGIVTAEILLVYLVNYLLREKAIPRIKMALGLILLCMFLSYTIMMQAMSITSTKLRVLALGHAIQLRAMSIPLYNNIFSIFVPIKNSLQMVERRGEGFFAQAAGVIHPLHYPLHPMNCKPPEKPLNVVVIALDAWRFDMMTQKITPNIYHFSKQSSIFTNHLSGGDGTQPGIFSLFYGLPANYWSAMEKYRRQPMLIQELLKANYQTGIFMSAQMHYPAFDKTVFTGVKNLITTTAGDEPFVRDRKITAEFLQFLKSRDKARPFFSFVFYDETHSYCESTVKYPHPFQPAIKVCNRIALTKKTNPIPYLNRYKNAVHFDDDLVGKLLGKLKQDDLLKNTIVVITSDHGEEFNETHKGYWGHTSNFTKWQTQTPFIVYWPNKAVKANPYLTTHYDFAPTMLQNVLQCKNPINDYSIGKSLYMKGDRPFSLIFSYIDYAMVKPNRITTILPMGNYTITDGKLNPIPNAQINVPIFKDSLDMQARYFRHQK